MQKKKTNIITKICISIHKKFEKLHKCTYLDNSVFVYLKDTTQKTLEKCYSHVKAWLYSKLIILKNKNSTVHLQCLVL